MSHSFPSIIERELDQLITWIVEVALPINMLNSHSMLQPSYSGVRARTTFTTAQVITSSALAKPDGNRLSDSQFQFVQNFE